MCGDTFSRLCGYACAGVCVYVRDTPPPAPCCHMQSRHEPWTHEGMFCSAGHVDAHLLNADTICRPALLLFHARKQAVIVMTQMVRAGFWHRKAGRQRETVMPKTWKWVESCPAPLTCVDFISYLYMWINIHKQCKIVVGANVGEKVRRLLPVNGGGPSLAWR